MLRRVTNCCSLQEWKINSKILSSANYLNDYAMFQKVIGAR